MLTFTQIIPDSIDKEILSTLSLTAEERTRSRYRFETHGEPLLLRLPRGTLLKDGDFLQAETGEIIQIKAKPEPVMTIKAKDELKLLKAAYHLGNRHVPVEITAAYLRLSPDPVLKTLLQQLDLEIFEEISPFFPEMGAYHHG